MLRRADDLIGIVPAGGRGTRLAPYPCPKELFPIGWQTVDIDRRRQRRPKVVSHYIIENMVEAGVDRIVMVVGEHKFDVLRYYGSGQDFGTRLSYVYQSEPRGMVHAISIALPWLSGRRVFLGMPDTVVRPKSALRQVHEAHARHRPALTLGLFRTKNPQKFGMIGLDDAGQVVAHVDKPKATELQTMWGLAIWEPELTQLLEEVVGGTDLAALGRELVFGDVIDEALRRRLPIRGVVIGDGSYVDIGTVDEIIEAHRLFDPEESDGR